MQNDTKHVGNSASEIISKRITIIFSGQGRMDRKKLSCLMSFSVKFFSDSQFFTLVRILHFAIKTVSYTGKNASG